VELLFPKYVSLPPDQKSSVYVEDNDLGCPYSFQVFHGLPGFAFWRPGRLHFLFSTSCLWYFRSILTRMSSHCFSLLSSRRFACSFRLCFCSTGTGRVPRAWVLPEKLYVLFTKSVFCSRVWLPALWSLCSVFFFVLTIIKRSIYLVLLHGVMLCSWC